MNQASARATIVGLISEIAPDADLELVPGDVDLREAVDLDSLDFLTLVERLAETTGVDVPEMDYDQVRSLDGLVAYVVSRTSDR